MTRYRLNKPEGHFEPETEASFAVPLTAAPNKFLGGPASGASAGTPNFRYLVPADFPGATAGARGILQLAGQLGGTADDPDVRGLRETGGPTRLAYGPIPDGTILKRSGSSVIGVSIGSVIGIQEPLGHDITQLPSIVSHWPILDTVLGGTSVPDVLGAHSATATNTIRSVGRPWYNSQGQVWLSAASIQSLANVGNLITEARDASCYWMGWIFVAGEVNATWRLFAIPQSGTGSGANTPYSLYLDSPNSRLTLAWQHSSNTTVTTVAEIAAGLHHVCAMRERSTTSTASIYIDGELAATASGLTNPSGGGSLTVARLAHSASPTGEANHAVLGDCVWGSGGLPTLAQIRTQYRRGMGSY